MKITKAVIACAGWSTRFLPAVKTYAKHLIPLLDKPHLQYVVEDLYYAGITNICIVHRPGEDTIKNHFTHNPKLNAYLKSTGKEKKLESLNKLIDNINFTFLPQTPDLPYGNATPLLVARDWIGQDDFIYLFGDDIIIENQPGQFFKEILSLYQQRQPDCIITIQSVPWEEIHHYGSIKFDPNDSSRIIGVFEKVSRDIAPSNFSQVSPYVYKNSILDLIAHLSIGKDNELWLADANNLLATQGTVLSAQIKNGFWMTTGDPLNWLLTNITLALKDPHFINPIRQLVSSKH